VRFSNPDSLKIVKSENIEIYLQALIQLTSVEEVIKEFADLFKSVAKMKGYQRDRHFSELIDFAKANGMLDYLKELALKYNVNLKIH